MGWVSSVLTSEFLWGTILGVGLSVVTARATLHYQARQQAVTVRSFAADLISNMQDYAKALEENRERSRVIFMDIVALIDNEIGIRARNREHLIHIKDDNLRKSVRDYFSRSAKLSVDVRMAIQDFNTFHQNAEIALENQDGPNRKLSMSALTVAHQHCDRLVTHINNPPKV